MNNCLFNLKKTTFLVVLLLCMLYVPLHFSNAETNQNKISSEKNACTKLLVELKKQNKMLSRDLGHIKRELLRLKYEMSRPGLREIFGGIGYILGIFGVAAYIKARQLEKQSNQNSVKG